MESSLSCSIPCDDSRVKGNIHLTNKEFVFNQVGDSRIFPISKRTFRINTSSDEISDHIEYAQDDTENSSIEIVRHSDVVYKIYGDQFSDTLWVADEQFILNVDHRAVGACEDN